MKRFFSSIAVKKGLGTLFLLFIYVLGSRITLPFIDLNSRDFLGGATAYLAFSTAITGGNLRSLSIFSVGLSPWMSSMILWQMFSFSKRLNLASGSAEVQDRRKMYLTLTIALIQSLALAVNLPIKDNYNTLLVLILNTTLLIAGTFFLIWLSDINSVIGVGGSIVILLTSMIIYIPQDIVQSIQKLGIPMWIIVILGAMGIVFAYLIAIFYRARYRIPVNKIGLHSRFKRYSYFDIMLNPAGGMPFMYVMSLINLPTYLLLLLQLFDPGNPVYQQITIQYAMGKPLWIYTYIATLFVFSIAFAFVNISGEQVAERMKKSGEYIYGIYPGEDTSKYINNLVFKFAIVGGIFNVLFAGLPMLFVLVDEQLLRVSMIPGLFMILSGMIFNIKDEIRALKLNETYKPLI
ncbi:accessory Sec system protein translocase subunit SecY2 [Streptococcus sp. oral taxon 431]|uniref:accessory Sec system protein translocase subunit SecY2 n=1 Tax=unclassified Streptococcus TaxID=2608887 RepID=UPI00076837D8|nr:MULTISPECIES: accessory Sec system protein translocase subunit SecY2 [unclassified Streptococcus]AMD96348.1 accessory Sec system protein translocase subunit SecY2 [Streptococcus sp. oral taxon 431]OFN82153.1 accessory Sec system protein translocase subunit SecY2 [Streptococcus sp. HMSC061D10]